MGANSTDLTCVVCTPQQPYPSVSPRPVLSSVPLAVPVAAADGGAAELESRLVLANAKMARLRWQLAQPGAADDAVAASELEAALQARASAAAPPPPSPPLPAPSPARLPRCAARPAP